MTNDEAKFILSAFRPNGADTDDPHFGEALRMAGTDPVLGAWFERSRSHDSTVASKLREIVPPARLRESILAGARVSAGPRSFLMSFTWAAGLAAAAALAIVVATMKVPVGGDATISAFGGFAIRDVVNGKHGGSGAPEAALVSQLQASQAPMPGDDQIDFDKLRQTGCRTLSFGGRDIVEVCFARNGAMFHLYVSRIDASQGEIASRGPSYVRQAEGAAAVWSDRTYVFALASTAGVEAIRKLL
jgi:hypothetical protein